MLLHETSTDVFLLKVSFNLSELWTKNYGPFYINQNVCEKCIKMHQPRFILRANGSNF